MASRIPLTVNSSSLSLEELPSGIDLDITGSNVVSTSTTVGLLTTGVTTLNIGSASTTLTLGASTGTTTVNNTLAAAGLLTTADPIPTIGGLTSSTTDDNLDKGIQFRWATGGVAKLGFFGYDDSTGKFTFVPDVTITSNVVSGTAGPVAFGAIEGTSGSFSSSLAVTGVTTLTGALNANGGIAVDTNAFTVADTTGNTAIAGTLAVTGATTLTGALAANGGITVDSTNFTVDGTTGAVSTASTLSVGGNTTLTGDLAVNGGDITTTATGTATVFNTNATTLNIGGAATTVSIGAATGTATINNANVVITGNLTVNGTTTTINSTTVAVDDITLELGTVATPTDTTANGGGIVLKGATDKSITWSTTGWTSSEDWNLVTGKQYEINGTAVLSATTLGSGVTASSLTSVGTLTTGTWNATVIAGQYGGTGVNNSGKTITLGGNLTTSGAFATTLTVTAATNVTLPTTGTLATLAGTETLTNKTLTSPTLTTPSLGVATATSINKVAITAPATGSTLTIADGKTLTASNTLTFTGTDASSVAFGAGGTVAYTANKLSAFAATTSAELLGVISDETGSGSLVFATSPSLTTPTIGGGANFSGSTSGTLNLKAAAAAGTGVIVTIPATTGTIVTTGDSGTVTSTMIADGTIVNGDISASAAIAVSKLAASTISGITLGNNLNTLTMNVSGTGLSGSTTYNGSAAATFTVTSNATSANTASTVVARDASGNFTAGTITAALSGNASTATKLETARTISLGGDLSGSTTFDGSGNVTITATIAANSVALGTDTTGAYVADIVAGTGIALTETADNAEGNTVTITNNGVTSITGTTNQVTASASTGGVTLSLPQSIATSSSVQFGSFGVGTAASGTTGEIRATNAITSYYSDERLKKEITVIENAVDKVMQLRGVTFKANEIAESFGYTSTQEQVGVIAQDVQKVLPQVVVPAPFDRIRIDENTEISRSGENYMTVHYEKIVPLLIEAIKEQQAQIEELKAKLGN